MVSSSQTSIIAGEGTLHHRLRQDVQLLHDVSYLLSSIAVLVHKCSKGRFRRFGFFAYQLRRLALLAGKATLAPPTY